MEYKPLNSSSSSSSSERKKSSVVGCRLSAVGCRLSAVGSFHLFTSLFTTSNERTNERTNDAKRRPNERPNERCRRAAVAAARNRVSKRGAPPPTSNIVIRLCSAYDLPCVSSFVGVRFRAMLPKSNKTANGKRQWHAPSAGLCNRGWL